MREILQTWRGTKPTRSQYMKAAVLGFCGALGFQAVACIMELRETDSEAHPIGRMHAEQLAREGVRDLHGRLFGANARQTSDAWFVSSASYCRRSFSYSYRLTDTEGNEQYYGVRVSFDENGVAALSF